MAACHALCQAIEKLNLSFPEAYQFLLEKDKLILENKTYVVDLSASKLWEVEDKLPKSCPQSQSAKIPYLDGQKLHQSPLIPHFEIDPMFFTCVYTINLILGKDGARK